jgi:hypothetical protein
VCLPITFITTSILTNFEVCLPITFISLTMRQRKMNMER